MKENIIKSISKLFDSSRLVTESEALRQYEKAGFVEGYEPVCAVKVADGFEIEKLVRLANEEGIKLIPFSSTGEHRNGGGVPAVEDAVIVDLTGMKKIYDSDRTFRVTAIEAGVTYEELIPELEKKDLIIDMPLAPKAGKSVLASLLETEPRLNPNMQWNVLDPIRTTEVIWGDGNRMRTGEAAGMPLDLGGEETIRFAHEKKHQYLVNMCGPDTIDYYRLLTGAQGTMGIVSWGTVKCALRPELQEAHLVASDKLDYVIEFMYQMEHLRCSDGLFVLNDKDLAALMSDCGEEAKALSKKLPKWTAVAVLASRPPLPQKRLNGQRECMEIAASNAKVRLTRQIAGLTADEIMKKAFSPCKPGKYWKDVDKGASVDVFFLCTMDRAHEFIDIARKEAKKAGYPEEDLGIYIQPKHQGVSCKVEIRIPYADTEEASARALYDALPKPLFEEGAFFSRPYGPQTAVQLPEDKRSTIRLKKLKGIFDPNNVLNPGHLSDWQRLSK